MIDRFQIDPGQSRLTVQAFASGMLSGFAHSPIFAAGDLHGWLRFNPDKAADGSFEIVVRSDSLNLTDKVKEDDRAQIMATMQNQVLDIAKYPEIDFRSTGIAASRIADNWYRLSMQGHMRLHGRCNPLSVDGQLRMTDEGMQLSGEFLLSMAAFRLKPVSALGGMVKVKDQIKLKFDLVGGRKLEAAK